MKAKRILASLLTACLLLTGLLPAASAEESDLTLTEGEILRAFTDAGSVCESSDPSVAWVDAAGDLRALKAGQTTITMDGQSRTVTVNEFEDGSETVGQLKIVARYNDSMQFYDGHVYLIFTSYLDGVTLTVDDLYAGYEISDLYYLDIRNDISAGSNHTGKNAERYFTLQDGMTSVTLDRGEVVSIGMYRDFDLSVPAAALGSVQNSTAWETLSAALKTMIVQAIFGILEAHDVENAFADLLLTLSENGLDYHLLLDGTVDGGVCFNRELYNQKLEWDQYENATYELDVTQKQLDRLTAALSGNRNRFSILKNSCATVALRAWNEAVGTCDGEETAYRLEPSGEGLFALIDAPKTVKDGIQTKLPGYYLNKSDSTPEELEPNAGFYDDTGWVYVSAPEVLPGLDDGNYLIPTVTGGAAEETTVWYLDGEERIELPLGERTALAPYTQFFVRTTLLPTDCEHVLSDITLNDTSILWAWMEDIQAYTWFMPDTSTVLNISYAPARVEAKASNLIQCFVGDTFSVSDFAALEIGGEASDALAWTLLEEETEVIQYADEAYRTLTAAAAGSTLAWAGAEGNPNVGVPFVIEVHDSAEELVKVTFSEEDSRFALTAQGENGTYRLSNSGCLVPKGTVVSVELTQTEPVVVSRYEVNGAPARLADAVTLETDTDFLLEFREAEIVNLPREIRLENAAATCRLEASVQYVGAADEPVYDPSIRYVSPDPRIAVDENGLLRVTGEIPAEGGCVYVTAYAAAGNDKVFARTKVVLGDYAGDRIVGRFTISSRSVSTSQNMPHTAITFTTYEDLKFPVSYTRYYEPTEAYEALMDDYATNPDAYPGDPALYSEELDLGDRESYFVEHVGGGEDAPQTILLRAQDAITISNYALDSNSQTVLDALENGQLASSGAVQALIEQFRLYQSENGDFDGAVAFDSLLATVQQMLQSAQLDGGNPADGHTTGGRNLNREAYNQFRTNNSQLPNTFYTVELTADQLAILLAELANPENNYFSLFTNNCTGVCVDLWNTVLAEREDLRLQGNLSGLMPDPESLYLELGALTVKTGKIFFGTGEGGGINIYPRIRAGHPAEERPSLPFIDVAEGEYYYDAVSWAYFHDPRITEGTSPTTFSPDGKVTRGQVVTFLWRAAGMPTAETDALQNPFADVPNDTYYTEAVLWAVSRGITNGTSNTTFHPDRTCTRGEIVTFLYRFEGSPEIGAVENPFTDVPEGQFYTKPVLWAVETHVTAGTSATTFSPNATCTRAQVVTFLYRDVVE